MNILIWHFSSNIKKNIIPVLEKKRGINILGIITQKIIPKFNCYLDEKAIINLKPDYVFISSITSSHYKEVKFCLDNNVNVLIEKPISNSYKKTKFLIDLARRKNLKLIEVLMFIYHPQFIKLQEILNSDRNGKLLFGNIIFTIPHLDKNNFRYKKNQGGGAYLDLGIYIFSLLYFIFGKNIYLKNYQSYKGKKLVETNCLFTFSLKNNKQSKIIGVCGFGFNYNNRLDLVYEKRTISANLIFSKPRKINPNIIISDGLKIERSHYFRKEINQFSLMFDYIYKNKINFDLYYKDLLKTYKFFFNN